MDAPIFTEGGDDRGEYENRLCRENRWHDFRCQRNARRERKAYAGGACKGSDCKRSNGFAGSRGCLIDFTQHRNVPDVLSQVSGAFAGNNIESQTNRSKKEYAYTILDLANAPTADSLQKIQAIDGVIRVRVL